MLYGLRAPDFCVHGLVLAADFVVFVGSTRENGGRFFGSIRERCERCVEKILQKEGVVMKEYAKKFLEVAFEYEALRLGRFELKSGRISPYFFDAGMFRSGKALKCIGDCYAQVLCAEDFFTEEDAPILFGPAYKGILIVAATAISLTEYGENAFFSSLRKEEKEHGEKGFCIGQPTDNCHAVVLEDVVSGGGTIRSTLQYIRSLHGFPVGVVVGFNRQERHPTINQSVIQVLRQELGVRIESIATLSDMCEFVRGHGKYQHFFGTLNAYRTEFCVS